MRFYAIGNGYLSSIQHGIQAFHVLGEMAVFYAPRKQLLGPSKAEMDYNAWLNDHKTLICLNGGHDAKLKDLWEFLNVPENPYPFAKFHEENMGNMLTSIGIVVPETVYGIDLADASTWGTLTPWEVELATRLKRMSTAR